MAKLSSSELLALGGVLPELHNLHNFTPPPLLKIFIYLLVQAASIGTSRLYWYFSRLYWYFSRLYWYR
jgi:hypothetical protein